MKHGHGYQTWYELVDPKQGYNGAMFEKLHLDSVREKAYDNVLSNQETCQLYPFNLFESQIQWYIHALSVLNNPTKFQLNRTRP